MFVMNPEAIITKICNAIDQIMEGSKPYEGLFPSIMHPQTGDMLMEKPPKIPGQRDGDRAHLGSNLIHDEPYSPRCTHSLRRNHTYPNWRTRCGNTPWFTLTDFSPHPTTSKRVNSSVYASARRIESSSACRFGEASTVQEQRVVRRCFVSVDGD